MPDTIAKKLAAICPACGARVTFEARPQLSQLLSCGTCDAMLEVVSVNPVELEWVFDDETYEYEYDDDLEAEYEDDDFDYEDEDLD